MDYNPFGFNTKGRVTANAGTAYTQFIESLDNPGCLTVLNFAQVTVGATAQTLVAMRPLSAQALPGSSGQRCSCYLTAAAAAGQAVININQDPGVYTAYSFKNGATPRTANNGIAANDYLAFQYPDGSWGVDTVSSVSTLAITLSNNLATGGLASGAPVWFFGISTNVNPYDGLVHPTFTLPASTVVNLGSTFPFCNSLGLAEPILLYCANGTNASVLESVGASYANRTGPFSAYA